MNINELDAYLDKQIELLDIVITDCERMALRLIIRDIHNDGFKEGIDLVHAQIKESK